MHFSPGHWSKQAEQQSCAIASHLVVLPYGAHFKRKSLLRKENARWKYSDSQWKWVGEHSLGIEGLSSIGSGCKEAVCAVTCTLCWMSAVPLTLTAKASIGLRKKEKKSSSYPGYSSLRGEMLQPQNVPRTKINANLRQPLPFCGWLACYQRQWKRSCDICHLLKLWMM